MINNYGITADTKDINILKPLEEAAYAVTFFYETVADYQCSVTFSLRDTLYTQYYFV